MSTPNQYTLNINASASAIKKHADNPSVRDINDPRYAGVLFRYHASRKTGSWLLRKGGKTKALGSFPTMTIEDVAKNLPFIEINLACGLPIESAVVQHWTVVDDLLHWYLDRVQSLPKSKMSDHRKSTIKSAIVKHLSPRLGEVPVLELDKRTLDECLILPLCHLSDSFLGLVFGVLSTAYRRAREIDLIPHNPMSDIKLKQFGIRKSNPKPCAIRKSQLPSVLEAAVGAEPQARFLALLMLMHGTRIGETRMATWHEFDFDSKLWTVPPEHTKNGTELVMPLTDASMAIIEQYRQWQRQHYRGQCVFHNKRRRGHLNGNEANELIQSVSKLQWQSHDLRKRFRTSLTDLRVDWWVGELLVNHTLPELSVVYVHTQAEHLKREAVERHHKWLQSLSSAFQTVTDM